MEGEHIRREDFDLVVCETELPQGREVVDVLDLADRVV